jgi:hypothetical protein
MLTVPMPRLAWLLIVSTVANVITAGLLVYLAFSTLRVRVIDGSIYARTVILASAGDPVPVRVVVDRYENGIPVEVKNTVTVKTGFFDPPLDVKVR